LGNAAGSASFLCPVHVQKPDSGLLTFSSKARSSSEKTSPFHEIISYVLNSYRVAALAAVLMIIIMMASNLMKMKYGSPDWLMQ